MSISFRPGFTRDVPQICEEFEEMSTRLESGLKCRESRAIRLRCRTAPKVIVAAMVPGGILAPSCVEVLLVYVLVV